LFTLFILVISLFSYIIDMKSKRALTIVILLVAGISLVAIGLFHPIGTFKRVSKGTSREEYIKMAKGYLHENRPESAIYPLLLAIQKDSSDAAAHLLLAQAYFQTEVYHLAEEECQTGLRLNPQNREVKELLCRIKFERGKEAWEKENRLPAISQFQFIVKEGQDQELIDSIAQMTGGRYKIKRLTNDLLFDDAPSFSPDGKRIIYYSDTSYYLEDYGLKKIQLKRSKIWLMDLDGQNRVCLSPEGEGETSERFARFSHDGNYIVYEKENSPPRMGDTSFNCDRDIYMKNLSTGEVRRLTHDPTYDALPSFSPDDKKIIFLSDRPGGESSLYELDLKTGETRNIYMKESWNEKIGLYTKPQEMVLPYYPSFSPDGDKILLHAGYETRGVFLLDPKKEELTRLTDRATDCYFPSFSADGERIVFVSGSSEEEDLFLMKSDGTGLTRLTYDGGSKRYPTFSPDGKSIVFSAKREGEPDYYFEIYLLSLDQTISPDKLEERLKELERRISEKDSSGTGKSEIN
jgi:Tol biopolymer transport system component